MSTIRHFTGSRDTTTRNPAIELKKLEIQKRGKLPANVRYKYILKKKQEQRLGQESETPEETYDSLMKKNLGLMDKKIGGRKRSKRAEQALKEIAMKKANKEERALRQMVVVQRQNFHNGSIDSKGRIYDIASNQVGQVNLKNGKMAAMNGWSIGKYKPKSMMTNLAIQDAINKYSPYYINLRKMQQMQQGIDAQQVVNLYGHAGSNPLYGSTQDPNKPAEYSDYYGSNPTGPRQNIGMTAWGAMSNNAWGTFADNAWGTVSDNAWGTASTNVWGGIDGGSLWGQKGPKIWGTGTGKNYLAKMGNYLAAMFGLKVKIKGASAAKREFLAEHRTKRTNGGSTTVRTSARR